MEGSSTAYLRDMNTLFEAGTVGGLSDRQLLERFRTRRNGEAEAAFEAIVLRHGPMVLRVCRNALPEPADAQDAFQATFLVLLRACGSIRRLDSIGSWLFGVANRVAARVRADAARRRSVEQAGGLRIAATGDRDGDFAERYDLRLLLQAEVERLPENYRAVVFLCYWEGLTHEQAAIRLGCPLGTVRSRGARARNLLRHRLSRHGLGKETDALATAFESSAFWDLRALEIPGNLVSSTVELAKQASAGRFLAPFVSPSVFATAETVIRSMFMIRVKSIGACLFLLGAAACGLTLAAAQTGRGVRRANDPEQPPIAAESKAQPALESLGDYVVEPPDVLLVEVLEALPGRPISGERMVYPDGKIYLGFYGEVYVAGLTVAEVKEKVVLHLRKFMGPEKLGLVVANSEGQEGEPAEATEKRKDVAPRDTNRVFVQVTKSNSKFYYLQGAFAVGGRVPLAGPERILDAVSKAGGLAPDADHKQVFLYHNSSKHGRVQTLKIDIDQITLGDDLSTNYQLRPGDRLVVRRLEGGAPAEAVSEPQPSEPVSRSQPGPRRRLSPLENESGANRPDSERRLGHRPATPGTADEPRSNRSLIRSLRR